jgi:hypothetical protein
LPDQTPEAKRLASEVLEAKRVVDDRDLERARALGRKEAEDEQERKQNREHFLDINGSIADMVGELHGLKDAVTEIKEEQMRRDLVNEALIKERKVSGSKTLSRRTTIISLVALGVAVLAGIVIPLIIVLASSR